MVEVTGGGAGPGVYADGEGFSVFFSDPTGGGYGLSFRAFGTAGEAGAFLARLAGRAGPVEILSPREHDRRLLELLGL